MLSLAVRVFDALQRRFVALGTITSYLLAP